MENSKVAGAAVNFRISVVVIFRKRMDGPEVFVCFVEVFHVLNSFFF